MTALLLALAILAPQDNGDDKADAKSDREAAREAVKEASKAADVAIKTFKESYKPNVSEGERAAAVQALGAEAKHDKVIRKLGQLCGSDVAGVRTEAAKALSSVTGEELQKTASGALLSALAANVKFPEVCAEIYAGIAHHDQLAHIVAISSFFEHRETEFAKQAILGAGKCGKKHSIPGILSVMKKYRGSGFSAKDGKLPRGKNLPGLPRLPRGAGKLDTDNTPPPRGKVLFDAALEAMKAITGSSFDQYDDWEQWWKENARTFQADPE
jgi:hypothetical protein